MGMKKLLLFLAITSCSPTSLPARGLRVVTTRNAGIGLENYVQLADNLETLFIGLYGENNPLLPYVMVIRKLTMSYAKEARSMRLHRTDADEALTNDLYDTLASLKEYGNSLLAHYQFANPDDPEQTHTLPAENYDTQPWQQNGFNEQAPLIETQQGSTLAQQQQSLQALFGAVSGAQQQFPHQIHSGHGQALKEMIMTIGVGLTVIAALTYFVQRTYSRHLPEMKSFAVNMEAEAQSIQGQAKTLVPQIKAAQPRQRGTTEDSE